MLFAPNPIRRILLILTLLGCSTTVVWAQDPVAVGYRDFTHNLVAPTSEKPESKLWYADSSWWGVLWNPTIGSNDIYRLDRATQTWIDTGTPVDSRSSSRADALWDEANQKLYVSSHVHTTSASATTDPSTWGRLYRYTYSGGTYSKDAGFPVNITRGKSEALTIAKDTTGTIWATFVQSQRVMVNHSGTSDTDWGIPYLLPGSTTATTTTTDDLSAVVAFGPGKIGVLWSNQATKKFYFSVHLDGDADNVWQPEQTALPGPNGTETSDDHINLKSVQTDNSGRVFAAIKTSLDSSNSPLVMLLVRDAAGNWSNNVFGRVTDHHTRPIVLLDTEHNRIYMFAASPDSGTPIAVFYKTSPMNNINFPKGRGAPFIQSTTELSINNPTSTKQNVTSATGLVVLASNPSLTCSTCGASAYFHNTLTLSGTPQPTISSFSPTTGPPGLGVTINGTGFLNANVAAFNGAAGTDLQIISNNQVQVTVPASAKTGPLTVTDPNGGIATSTSDFTVTTAPKITSFTPTSGRVGTVVTITGSGFTATTAVTFNGTPANFAFKSNSKLTATVPPGATTGRISVTNPAGTAQSSTVFTVTP
jgi:hypothetical protein